MTEKRETVTPTNIATKATSSSLPSTIETTCPYCGVGCGITVPLSERNEIPALLPSFSPVKISGTLTHPANGGKLCVKGTSVGETLDDHGRLTQAQVDGQTVPLASALDEVAQRLNRIIREHGADAVAFYVSGQLLTEDYYVANKLIKGHIGTANIDTNSRLCMASAVVGYKRAFGSDTVPTCYADLSACDLLIMIGSNAAWAHPILFKQIKDSKRQNPNKKVVLIDPRVTASADIADLHLPIRPGSDSFLFNGLLAYLHQQGQTDAAYIAEHVNGFDEALAAAIASSPSIEVVAQQCGLDPVVVQTFFEWVATTPKTVSFYSQGVNQSSSGVDKSNAIINVHLATGRIGLPGMGPFSITGQPNAMGGREVGGLANQLAAHMDFASAEDRDRVARFWQTPDMAKRNGLKAVDLFEAVGQGKIKAVWIMHTNPAVTMPNADAVVEALKQCECVIVSDNMADTDTTRLASICLPAASWGEKDGTVTNSERTISRQRAFLMPPGEAKADWWLMSQVAQRMGFEGFDYANAFDIFQEHVELTAFENSNAPGHKRRDLDLSAWLTLSPEDYDALSPIQWPVTTKQPQGTSRLFKPFDVDDRFFTTDGRANCVAITPRYPQTLPSAKWPYVFNTGRYRDQWHTMTRTAKTPRLMQHRQEPLLNLHPQELKHLGIEPGALVQVHNDLARVVMRVAADSGLQSKQAFAPMHWTDQYASAARVDSLIAAVTDPLSGQPESKHAVVAIDPLPLQWQGWMLLNRNQLSTLANFWQSKDYWCRVDYGAVQLIWLAQDQAFDGQLIRALAQACGSTWQVAEFDNPVNGEMRQCWYDESGMTQVLLVKRSMTAGQSIDGLPTPWVAIQQWKSQWSGQSQRQPLNPSQRFQFLSLVDVDQPDLGDMICACHQVPQQHILDCIATGAETAEAIGQCCKAGTQCGSCVSELNHMLAQTAREALA